MVLVIQSLVSLAVLCWSASAAPEPLKQAVKAVNNKQTFSVQQVPVARTSRWNGPMSMRRVYMKYNLQVPKWVDRAAEAAEAETLPVFQPNAGGKTSIPVRPVKGDVEYLIIAQVGNHNLSLDLDTGSSDLYVSSSPPCLTRRKYFKQLPSRVFSNTKRSLWT
jgi:PIN domain nuclease of toxin-antitoxin system